MPNKPHLLFSALLTAGLITGCSSDSSSGGAPVADADSDTVADANDNCPNTANTDQTDTDLNGMGDACDPIPSTYAFDSQLVDGVSAVSYTGQTKRQVLLDKLVHELKSLSPRASTNTDPVVTDLNYYYRFDASVADSSDYNMTDVLSSLTQNEIIPGDTWGDIASGKDLVGKTAGNDPDLINGEFFGWTTGMDADPVPVELVDYFFQEVENEHRSDPFTIITSGGPVDIDSPVLSEYGHDYRQLIQKFLHGAVGFSQGTGDYLQTDWQATNAPEGDDPYTEGGHNWDEAFGYFGAARDYPAYEDVEIRGKGEGRAEYGNGYHDTNGDGLIDLRSEINFANSVNCAKRDYGSRNNTNPTNFTKEAFDAFLLGRKILNNAAGGTLSQEEEDLLNEQIRIAAVTWEKCISATVIHYINDTLADMAEFDSGNFANEDNFTNLAKHWGEMKGFALGLQFNPLSPFRSGTVTDIDVDDLKQVLSLMGDAPVLPDGTQNGSAFTGGVSQYMSDLEDARDILQAAYEFDAENVAGW